MDFTDGASGKEPACQCQRCKRREFYPCGGKMPWKRAWQPTPVFLPGLGESHGQRNLVGSRPWGRKESDVTQQEHYYYNFIKDALKIWQVCAGEGRSDCTQFVAVASIRGSVQFSRSVVSNSLRPHESQHTRPPCPSPTPGVYPNSCSLSW